MTSSEDRDLDIRHSTNFPCNIAVMNVHYFRSSSRVCIYRAFGNANDHKSPYIGKAKRVLGQTYRRRDLTSKAFIQQTMLDNIKKAFSKVERIPVEKSGADRVSLLFFWHLPYAYVEESPFPLPFSPCLCQKGRATLLLSLQKPLNILHCLPGTSGLKRHLSQAKSSPGWDAHDFEDAAPSWSELGDLIAAKRKKLDLPSPDLDAVSPCSLHLQSLTTVQ